MYSVLVGESIYRQSLLAEKRGARIRTPSGAAISSTIFFSFFPPPFLLHVGPVQTTIFSRLLAFIMSEAVGAARRCADTHAPGLRSAGLATVAKPAAPPHSSAITDARCIMDCERFLDSVSFLFLDVKNLFVIARHLHKRLAEERRRRLGGGGGSDAVLGESQVL